jgi:hypothetical protein
VEESRFCTGCGAVASPDNAFCGKCGMPVGPWNASAVPVPLAIPAVSDSKRSTPRRRFLAAAIAALLVVGTLASLGYYQFGRGATAPPSSPSPTAMLQSTPTATPVMQGVMGIVFLIEDPNSPAVSILNDTCYGVGGYADIGSGTAVTMTDERGLILAVGNLEDGVFGWSGAAVGCNFRFGLGNVPDTAKFYSVEVSHRGKVTYSHEEMNAMGWSLQLTIG